VSGHHASTHGGHDETRTLAQFASSLTYEALPPEVVAKAKISVLDTLGVCCFGSTLDSVRKLAAMIEAEKHDGASHVFGLHLRTSASGAALVNATSAHAFQLDEMHIGSTLHPGAIAVPVAIALAEERGNASGRDVIAAIVAATEVGTRVGLAAKGAMFTRGWHNQGTSGVFIAAAAAGSMLGLDAAGMQHALGLAGSQAAGLMAVQEGAMAKGFHSGRAAQSGVYAAKLAARGFTGIPDVLEAPYGGFFSTLVGDYAATELTAGLGTRWEILKTGFKPAPASNGSITAMWALDRVMHDHALEASDIREVTAHVSTNTLHHCGWEYEPAKVQGVLAAQMNLRYGMAVMALERRATPAEFTAGKMRDPAVLEFITRVKVEHEPRYDEPGGKLRVACRAVVVTRDGRTLEAEVPYRKGSFEDPMTADEIAAKFRDLAGKALTASAVDEIAAVVGRLETLDSIAALTRVLADPQSLKS
jgi:2-methylcitrate dehydratase PrpD